MKTRIGSSSVLLVACAAVLQAAYGQQPPDVVQSDVYENTAMGTSALLSVTPSFTSGLGLGNTASGYAALSANTYGSFNAASGDAALQHNTSGSYNTAFGPQALYFNVSGVENSATGALALGLNTTGNFNTASGAYALEQNSSGNFNTAAGSFAVYGNTTASYNTGFGASALYANISGSDNTASGFRTLYYMTAGSRNNAVGSNALFYNTASDNNAIGYVAIYTNTTGARNNALGNFSLYYNRSGDNNNATGYAALYRNTSGANNTAQGFYALQHNTTGSNNIALGQYAGGNLTTGDNNIDIGSGGVAGESAVIRIGSTAAAAYVAGISGAKITGSAVYVTSAGQLGVLASSERYKTAVATMGASSAKLQKLRPVTFHLKSDPQALTQYGLIAEEVAKVYPELVLRDAAGQIEGVRYEELTPMLLNEVQQQAAQIRDLKRQQERIATQAAELLSMRQQLAELIALNRETRAALGRLARRDEFIAGR